MGRSTAVVCDDSNNLVARVEFHEFRGLRAFLIHVTKNDTGKPPHHIQKFEGETWVCFKPSFEITA